MNLLGNLILSRRRAAGKTLRDLARELGLRSSTLGQLERGQLVLDRSYWRGLIESLGNLTWEELEEAADAEARAADAEARIAKAGAEAMDVLQGAMERASAQDVSRGATWLPRVQALADLALALGEVQRATQHPDGRPETDTTHTVMLALTAADLAPSLGVDPGEAVMFALVHDLVEALAGDTNTLHGLTAEEQQEKRAREAAGLEKLREDLSGSPWVLDWIQRYELQGVRAARLVRYLDKIMPKLTHRKNGGKAILESGVSKAELQRLHAQQGQKLRETYPDLAPLTGLFDAAAAAAIDVYLEEGHQLGLFGAPPMAGGTSCGQ